MRQYFGKYRGTVESNVDPYNMGRIQVSVPDVLGNGKQSWAMPCVPYAGKGVGFFAIPPNKANVWVEFERGDPDYPIWTGCFWNRNEAPGAPSAVAEVKMLKTDAITMTFSDLADGGGFTLEVGPPVASVPMRLVFNASGIEISNGTPNIKITSANDAPPRVTINDGALEII